MWNSFYCVFIISKGNEHVMNPFNNLLLYSLLRIIYTLLNILSLLDILKIIKNISQYIKLYTQLRM